jgi:phage/plasmid-associated DNA primase
MQKINFSVAQSGLGDLAKSARFGAGKVQISPAPNLVTGTITECAYTPAEFGPFLRTLRSNQALILGSSGIPVADVVIDSKLNYIRGTSGNPDKIISRTKKYLAYHKTPGVLLLDHDAAKPGSICAGGISPHPLQVDDPVTLLMVVEHLCGLPEIAAACKVSTGSSSSHIYQGDTELIGSKGGFHLYMFVQDASDIPRFTTTLCKRLVLAGYGHIQASKPGGALLKTIIDQAVRDPERLVYEARLLCSDGLEQRLPEPVYTPGDLLDTTALPDLSSDEEAAYRVIVEELKTLAQPMLRAIKTAHEIVEAAKLTHLSQPDALAVVRTRADRILSDEDILYFQKNSPSGTTVADVLNTPENWNGESLADPQEPDYNGDSKTVAKFYWNDGKPVINTYAHGGFVYKFTRVPAAVAGGDIDPITAFGELPVVQPPSRFANATGAWVPDNIPDIWQYADAQWVVNDSAAQDWYWDNSLPDEREFPTEHEMAQHKLLDDILGHNAFTDFEEGRMDECIIGNFSIKAKVVNNRKKTLRKEANAESNREIHWSHADVVDDYLAQLEVDGRHVVGTEGAVWVYDPDEGVYQKHTLDYLSVVMGDRYRRTILCKADGGGVAVAKKLYKTVEKLRFFEDAKRGVPCKDKFYSISKNGELREEVYSPLLKQRFKFSFNLVKKDLPDGSLFSKWLNDSFQHPDPTYKQEQIESLQMAFGSIIAGVGDLTQQALFFIGGGQNGKSVFIDMCNTLFPPDDIGHVSPADFGDRQVMATLADKRLNLCGDVDKSKKILSGMFKRLLGGEEPIVVKTVFVQPYAIQPFAVHVWSANDYLRTDDWSLGFKRRFMIFRFLNKISLSNKIERLGQKIAQEEGKYLLYWGLLGAIKLAQGPERWHIKETRAHWEAMREWQGEMNSIDAFFADGDTIRPDGDGRINIKTPSHGLYSTYTDWCDQNYRKRYGITKFIKQLTTDYKVSKENIGTFLEGYALTNPPFPTTEDK